MPIEKLTREERNRYTARAKEMNNLISPTSQDDETEVTATVYLLSCIFLTAINVKLNNTVIDELARNIMETMDSFRKKIQDVIDETGPSLN